MDRWAPFIVPFREVLKGFQKDLNQIGHRNSFEDLEKPQKKLNIPDFDAINGPGAENIE